MRDVVFESSLLDDGHLDCPRQYALRNAKFRVIVSLPEEAGDPEIEAAAALDGSGETLSVKERAYHLGLSDTP
jgi:hypothetical protein